MNLEVIKQILMSKDDYWVLAKKKYRTVYSDMERVDDDIVLVYFPNDIPRGLKYEEIMLNHIESFSSLYIDWNIYLNKDYGPFQKGFSFYDVYRATPVTCKCKVFLEAALRLKSNYIHDYENLIKQIQEGCPIPVQ